MPIIQFSEADKLAGKIMDKGVYTFEVIEIDGPKESGSKKSFHFWTTLKVTDGKFLNKELRLCFNTEMEAPSVLGSVQFLPHRDLLKLKAVIEKIKFDDVDLAVDIDGLLHRPFDAMVDQVISDGNVVNVITTFMSAGSGTQAMKVPF